MDYFQIGFEYSPAPLVILSYRIIQDSNLAFAELFGYSKAQLIDKSIATLFPTIDDYKKIGQNALAGLNNPTNGNYCDERFMQHSSGEVFWAQCNARTMTPEDPFKLVICHFERRDKEEQTHITLTKREIEISHYVANGLTCKQIAKILSLSPRTVEVHKANLMKKLGVKSKQQLLSKSLLNIQNS